MTAPLDINLAYQMNQIMAPFFLFIVTIGKFKREVKSEHFLVRIFG